MQDTKVTLSKGTTFELTSKISDIHIPDLRKIAQSINNDSDVTDGHACAVDVLTCWHIACDLKRHIIETGQGDEGRYDPQAEQTP